MRVLCVGRHAYLSEHLCRVFHDAGADCQPAVGATEALQIAARLEPQVLVCDSGLITQALLESWAREPLLAGVPVLAVSLTPSAEDLPPAEGSGLAATIFLPGLDSAQIAGLLASVYRPRGVTAPRGFGVSPAAPSAHTR